MFKAWRENRAYNRARLRIIRKWREVKAFMPVDETTNTEYTNGYYAGLDRAVNILAEELGRK